MSRFLLTVLFTRLCMVIIKILIFTFVTQIQFDTRNPNYFPLAALSAKQSQAQRASPTSKWSSFINTRHLILPVLFKMMPWSSSKFKCRLGKGWVWRALSAGWDLPRMWADTEEPPAFPWEQCWDLHWPSQNRGDQTRPQRWKPSDPLQVPLESSWWSFPSYMRQ